MLCPVCGEGELKRETRSVNYVYKGQQTRLSPVTGDFCDHCGESLLDLTESDLSMKEMKAFIRKVNASFVDPVWIASVRKQFGLDQQTAGLVFGGGSNAFSRYETGKTKPPLALVKLLMLLERHPDLWEEVQSF
jgi:HTH-type transcriptional regulator/antitoxin MqsA